MTVFDDKIKALKTYRDSIIPTIEQVLKNNAHVITDMNSYEQLFEQGINADGIEIKTYEPYTAKTISIKLSKGQPVDRVTLRDTGEFESSFVVLFLDAGFVIVAEDAKTETLIEKYGNSIIGLTYENQNELIWNYIYYVLVEKRDSLL